MALPASSHNKNKSKLLRKKKNCAEIATRENRNKNLALQERKGKEKGKSIEARNTLVKTMF